MLKLLSIFKIKKIMENGQVEQQNQDQTPKETPKEELSNTIPASEANVAATVEGSTDTISNFSSGASSIKITFNYNEKLKEALKSWKVEAPNLGHVRAVPVEDAHIDYIIKAIGLV